MLALEDKRSAREKASKSRPWRRWIGLLLFAGVTCGAGFWAAVQINAGPSPDLAAEVQAPKYKALELGDIYVNLQSNAGTASDEDPQKLMRVNLSVLYSPANISSGTQDGKAKLSDREVRHRIGQEGPLIQDSFVQFMRQLTDDDLSGSAGMEMLKIELLKRARLVVGHDGPSDVLISELIIQ